MRTCPVILFDGVCGLCNRWVTFVLRRDKRGIFRFAPLQSDAGRALLPSPPTGDSIVVIDGDRVYVRSAAVLEILRRLGFPWSLARAAAVVPAPVRDAVYDFIARHRYRWFGRTESCRVPTADERERFLSS